MKTTLLHACLYTPLRNGSWGLPFIAEGEPGVGKSSVLRDYAASQGLACKVLDASSGEGAYGVIPMPLRHEGKLAVHYPAPEWVYDLGDYGVVFVDEMTSTPPLIQSAQMALVLDRSIGGHTLPRHVRIVGACNPVSQATYGHKIAPALANRCLWVSWPAPTVEEHAAFMSSQACEAVQVKDDSIAQAEEGRVLAAWPDAWAQAVTLELGFLQSQPQWKNRMPERNDPASGRSWPSDRSWETATRAYATSLVHKLSVEERDELITGCVGAPCYEAFSTWVDNADLPKASDVLDGKVKFAHSKLRIDRSYAIINGCLSLVLPNGSVKRSERADVLWRFIGALDGVMADLAIPAMEALVNAALITPSAIKVLAKAQKVVTAAKNAV